MKKVLITMCVLYIPVIFSGCAFNLISVKQIPTKLDSNTSCSDSFILAENTTVFINSAYNRVLRKGTRWDCVGSIMQGVVYKSKDQVLTVEASNIYEANIVVLSNKLVGFYLPVEHTFSPLDSKVKLNSQ